MVKDVHHQVAKIQGLEKFDLYQRAHILKMGKPRARTPRPKS